MADLWQPIETAPKDFLPLDLWVTADPAKWRVTDAYWHPEDGWCYDDESGRCSVNLWDTYVITHWMRVSPPVV